MKSGDVVILDNPSRSWLKHHLGTIQGYIGLVVSEAMVFHLNSMGGYDSWFFDGHLEHCDGLIKIDHFTPKEMKALKLEELS
jgi:hypothetical protein